MIKIFTLNMSHTVLGDQKIAVNDKYNSVFSIINKRRCTSVQLRILLSDRYYVIKTHYQIPLYDCNKTSHCYYLGYL